MTPPVLLVVVSGCFALVLSADDWPQFRGPGGRAFSESANPPVSFGQASNVMWKVAIPSGYSSPVVTGQRIVLTALNEGQLETICLNRTDGQILWRKVAPVDKIKITSDTDDAGPATPTPVTDGKSVYIRFGAFGVIAYDLDGSERWRQPLATPDLEARASPILVGDWLIILSDRESGSFIEARDKQTGHLQWHKERPQFRKNSATPFFWEHGHENELIVPGTAWLTSYDARTGTEKWRFNGTAHAAVSSPTAGEDLLFSTSMSDGRDGNYASSGTGPHAGENLLFSPGLNIDGNNDTPLYKPSFGEASEEKFPNTGNAVLAIHPGGSGDISRTHLAWKSTRNVPYGSSPLFYRGRLFTVKDGGLVSAFEVKSGAVIYQSERLNAPGDYYASAVAAAGRIYLASYDGIVTIIDAGTSTLTILAQTNLGERILATPALVDRHIVLRTAKTLYTFGVKP